jgi:oligopeptidase B
MNQSAFPTPPVARKHHAETTLHGVTLADDYAWLREKENPDVTVYLEAENAYADAVMAPLAGLREELYQEMLSHIKQTDISVPYRDGNWWYYSRTQEGLQYAVYCRKRGAATEPERGVPEEVLLDGNELAKGHAFFSIGATDITDDGRFLAYSTDTRGFRQYTLHIKNLTSGETLAGEVERVGSVTWAADNKSLFYTVEDEQQKRQFQLWRHTLGTPHSSDVLILEEPDERFNIATQQANRVFCRRTTPPAPSRSSCRARTSTNTPSTIAMASSSSAPTTAAATSVSSLRPSPRPAATTGPS